MAVDCAQWFSLEIPRALWSWKQPRSICKKWPTHFHVLQGWVGLVNGLISCITLPACHSHYSTILKLVIGDINVTLFNRDDKWVRNLLQVIFSLFLPSVYMFQEYVQARIWEIQNVQYYHHPGPVSNQCCVPRLFVSGPIFMNVQDLECVIHF